MLPPSAMPCHLPTPARLEAFSDGVIAVIITIMVLELKVPAEAGLLGLRSVLPTLAVYALSFTFTGVYWVNHGHLVDRLEQASTLVLWTNLLFLFVLSLLPFLTSYVATMHMDSFSVQLYAVLMIATALGFQALSSAILRHTRRAAREEPDPPRSEAQPAAADAPDSHAGELRKGWLSIVVYLLALGLAHWHPHLALGLLAAMTLLWIVPGLNLDELHGPAKSTSAPSQPVSRA